MWSYGIIAKTGRKQTFPAQTQGGRVDIVNRPFGDAKGLQILTVPETPCIIGGNAVFAPS